jgi:predicted nucleic acid-binding protein
VTLFLLDENVLRELKQGGNKNVQQWIATVDDTDLRLSVTTLFEKRRGAEALMKREPQRARRILDGIEALEKAFADRIVPIDGPVVAEWTRLLGNKNKDRWDVALAATARVHGLVVATRNVSDFAGRGVRILNPFKSPAEIGYLTIAAAQLMCRFAWDCAQPALFAPHDGVVCTTSRFVSGCRRGSGRPRSCRLVIVTRMTALRPCRPLSAWDHAGARSCANS